MIADQSAESNTADVPAFAPVEEMVSNERPLNPSISLSKSAHSLAVVSRLTICISPVLRRHHTLSTFRHFAEPPGARQSIELERYHPECDIA
jgi:hypothetical protein